MFSMVISQRLKELYNLLWVDHTINKETNTISNVLILPAFYI